MLLDVHDALRTAESAGRDSLSIQEWPALAEVLEVPPLTLLLPPENIDYPVTPQATGRAADVGKWIIGRGPRQLRDPSTGELLPQHPGEHSAREQRYLAVWAESLPYLPSTHPADQGSTEDFVAVIDWMRNLGDEQVQHMKE